MVDYPMLIDQMHEKGILQPTLTQIFQMMRSKPCEEDPNINMVLRSGTTIGGDVRKQLGDDGKGRDAPIGEPNLEIEYVRGMSKEAHKSFIKSLLQVIGI